MSAETKYTNGNVSPFESGDWGLMGYLGGRNFIDRHLNILRWRRASPHKLGEY